MILSEFSRINGQTVAALMRKNSHYWHNESLYVVIGNRGEYSFKDDIDAIKMDDEIKDGKAVIYKLTIKNDAVIKVQKNGTVNVA